MSEKRIDRLLIEVGEELDKATGKFGPLASAHEAYGVILEELDEFWDHVKGNTVHTEEARRELIQIAAMAIRTIIDVI